jgi:hypothetical protein
MRVTAAEHIEVAVRIDGQRDRQVDTLCDRAKQLRRAGLILIDRTFAESVLVARGDVEIVRAVRCYRPRVVLFDLATNTYYASVWAALPATGTSGGAGFAEDAVAHPASTAAATAQAW